MKNQYIYLFILAMFVTFNANSQSEEKNIYNVRYAFEAPAVAGLAALNYYNFGELEKNEKLDETTIMALDPNNVAGWNRGAINPYSDKYSQLSDYIFYSSFPYGFLLFLDKGIRQEWADISLMYIQALGITGASYSTAALHTSKIRPYAYHPDTEMWKRRGGGARNSFYGGHPSLTATATFFTAKVYSDYYPDRNFKYALYGIAGAATLTNAYFRYKGGFHFTSDIIIGVAWGTAVGLLVPELHKWRDGSSLSLTPFSGDYKGMTLSYQFK